MLPSAGSQQPVKLKFLFSAHLHQSSIVGSQKACGVGEVEASQISKTLKSTKLQTASNIEIRQSKVFKWHRGKWHVSFFYNELSLIFIIKSK